MTERFFYSNDNSAAVADAAELLDYRPTLWVRPQGERWNSETGWVFGEGHPVKDVGVVNSERLYEACKWRQEVSLAHGVMPDRLIPNIEFYQWYIEPGAWPLKPDDLFAEHSAVIDMVKAYWPWCKVGLWGIPLIHEGPRADHRGLQYVGALAEKCDIMCPSAYPKGDGFGNLRSNEALRLRTILDHALVWRKPLHVFLQPFFQNPKGTFWPLTANQFRLYCGLVKGFRPAAVEMWSMATRGDGWDHTLPPDCNVADVEVKALEVMKDVFDG